MVGAGANLFLYLSGWLDMPIGRGFEKLAQKLRYFGDLNGGRSAADQPFSSTRCWLLSLVPPLLFG
jgi:hypothetical protein